MMFGSRHRARQRIVRLMFVAARPLSGYEIAVITGLGSGRLYQALASLESESAVLGRFAAGPEPRCRRYTLGPEAHRYAMAGV